MSVLSYFTQQYGTAHRKKTSVISLVITSVIGGVFLVSGLALLLAPNDRSATTEGMVVEVESTRTNDGTMYSPVIEYEVDGQGYRFTRSIRTSFSPEIGQSYEVVYNPADPKDGAVAKGFGTIEFWLPMIFVLAGGLIIGVVLYSFITSLRRTKEIERLESKGTRLDGVLVDLITRNSSVSKGGKRRPQFQLVVAATSPQGEVKNYESDILVGMPSGLIGLDFKSAAVPMDVYVNPSDPEKHYVDLSDIPKLTPERIQQMIVNAATQSSTNTLPQTMAQSVAPSAPAMPANPELVAYVQQQRAAGFADSEITIMLTNAGWTEGDVKRVIGF